MTLQPNETTVLVPAVCNKWCQDASVACFATFCGIALLANAYVLISAFWLKHKPTVNLRLCISLAAADCWCALTQAAYTVVITFVPDSEINTTFRCCIGVVDRIRLGSMFTSIFHLLLIALNHFLGTRWPLQHRYWVTMSRCNVLIVALWLIPPLAYTIVARIAVWGTLQYPCTNDDSINPYFLIPTVINVWVPCCLTVSIYGYIMCIIRKQHFNPIVNEKHAVEQERSSTSTTLVLRRHNAKMSSVGLGGTSFAARNSSSRQAVVTTLLITLTFVLCWVPNTVSYFIFSKNQWNHLQSNRSIPLIDLRVRVGVSLFTYTLIIVKLLLNAVIYALRIAELREAMLRMRQHLRRLLILYILHQKESSTKLPRAGSGISSVHERTAYINIHSTDGSATFMNNSKQLSGREDNPVVETIFPSYQSSEAFTSPSSGDSSYHFLLPQFSSPLHTPASERKLRTSQT